MSETDGSEPEEVFPFYHDGRLVVSPIFLDGVLTSLEVRTSVFREPRAMREFAKWLTELADHAERVWRIAE